MFEQKFEKIWVTNRALSGDFKAKILAVAKSGLVDKILLREADLDELSYESLVDEILAILKPFDIELIIHSYFGVAERLGVRNLHFGFEKFMEFMADFSGKFSGKFGVSVHSLEQALKAQNLGADYLVAGHIFDTPSHSNEAGRGIVFLQSIIKNTKIPVYAIGGINTQNIELVRRSGAKGAYMMREILRMVKDDE